MHGEKCAGAETFQDHFAETGPRLDALLMPALIVGERAGHVSTKRKKKSAVPNAGHLTEPLRWNEVVLREFAVSEDAVSEDTEQPASPSTARDTPHRPTRDIGIVADGRPE